MDLEIIILTEVRQRKTNIILCHIYIVYIYHIYKAESLCCTSETNTLKINYISIKNFKNKVKKEKNLQQRMLYPKMLSSKFGAEVKSITDKLKLKEFSTTKPDLQEMLQEILQVKKKRLQLETRKQ